jgi:biotin synthesis protein BioG
MKTKFLIQQKNENCILFFNGWGMDENIVSNLKSYNFDICMIYDFNKLEKIENKFNQYKNLYVIAWSLGVYCASVVLQKSQLRIKKAIAINGTIKAIDNEEGIAKSIFERTLQTCNPTNKRKFDMRCFGGTKKYLESKKHHTKRTIENQINELDFIYSFYTEDNTDQWDFNVAIIGEKDLIFNYKNQLNHWKTRAKTVQLQSSHYLFDCFESWDEIISI